MRMSLLVLLVGALIGSATAWADRDGWEGGNGRAIAQKNRHGSDARRNGNREEQQIMSERRRADRESRPPGRLTREEREALHRDLNEIGRDIYPGRGASRR